MPLRALKDGQTIHSYNFSETEWRQLKEDKKNFTLLMPCCQNRAILKTSKLGTQFFAHSKRGDCTSQAESKEHLLAKTIIAQTCQDFGWEVTTEYQGETPNGEKWIADVYAKKNRVQLVFEVQWSPQREEVTRQRQERYRASGIRSAWLAKEKKRDYYEIEEYELPYFEIRYDEKSNNFSIPKYNVTLQEFIKGMLNKELTWFPQKNMEVNSGLVVLGDNCWKCHQPINVVAGLYVTNKEKNFSEFYKFKIVDKTIQSMLTRELKEEYKIGPIKQRYSRTVQQQYLSNGCYYCDAIYGDFFLTEQLMEYHDYNDFEPIITIKHRLGKEIPLPYQSWYFQGKRKNYSNSI